MQSATHFVLASVAILAVCAKPVSRVSYILRSHLSPLIRGLVSFDPQVAGHPADCEAATALQQSSADLGDCNGESLSRAGSIRSCSSHGCCRVGENGMPPARFFVDR